MDTLFNDDETKLAADVFVVIGVVVVVADVDSDIVDDETRMPIKLEKNMKF